MKLNSFRELFLCLLSDVYEVENLIVTNGPKLAKKIHSEKLREALVDHIDETKMQIKRLDRIFKILNEKPVRVEWTHDIKSIFTDAERFMKDNPVSPLLDAAIVVFLQRIEHFEIATYGTLKEFADVLDNAEIKSIIEETLKEEGKADTMLTKLAKGGVFATGINEAAIRNA